MFQLYDGRYPYQAAVITCVDGAWLKASLAAVEKLTGIIKYDLYTLPGSQKNLLQKPFSVRALFVLDELTEVSIIKHKVPLVIVMAHFNCAGYGGSGAFASEEEEFLQYEKDLKLAVANLARAISIRYHQAGSCIIMPTFKAYAWKPIGDGRYNPVEIEL